MSSETDHVCFCWSEKCFGFTRTENATFPLNTIFYMRTPGRCVRRGLRSCSEARPGDSPRHVSPESCCLLRILVASLKSTIADLTHGCETRTKAFPIPVVHKPANWMAAGKPSSRLPELLTKKAFYRLRCAHKVD